MRQWGPSAESGGDLSWDFIGRAFTEQSMFGSLLLLALICSTAILDLIIRQFMAGFDCLVNCSIRLDLAEPNVVYYVQLQLTKIAFKF